MTGKLDIRSIDYDHFQSVVERYDTVAPSKLADLDLRRYIEIPKEIAARKAKNEAYLTKEELVTLVEWKVSHGKFRPTLKSLALSNSEEHVEAVSRSAYTIDKTDKALKALVALRGVGPATASLLLSVHNLDNNPFFSDELFRWCLWEEKPGCGWDRSIKYNAKEYAEMLSKVDELRERLNAESKQSISAVDCEKVAYVLGKTEVNLATHRDSQSRRKRTLSEVDETAIQPESSKRLLSEVDESDIQPESLKRSDRKTRSKK